MKTNKGFTLIELVVVIVILGILAVTAVPRFINLQGDAEQAAVEGVAGAVSSGAAINYAAAAANNAGAITVDAGTTDCDGLVQQLVPSVDWTNDYAVTAGVIGTDGDAAGTTATCTVTDDTSTYSADAVVIITTP